MGNGYFGQLYFSQYLGQPSMIGTGFFSPPVFKVLNTNGSPSTSVGAEAINAPVFKTTDQNYAPIFNVTF